MLVHCIGVSSTMYSLSTVRTNLLEFLFEAGYDVWLLDFRFSILLPDAARQHSFDEVATLDYPAAVAAVLAATGRPSLRVVAHGVGSSTLTMALLAGLAGVRAASVRRCPPTWKCHG
jgi:cholesterol oxidase